MPNQLTINFKYFIINKNGLISSDLYKYVSDKYSLAIREKNITDNNISQALVYVARLNNADAKVDLLNPIRENNKEVAGISFNSLYSAINKLNSVAILSYNATTIDDFLSFNNIKVKPEWAKICANLGSPISSTHIEND